MFRSIRLTRMKRDFLAIFDVDGTLVDSQAIISSTMQTAFEKAGAQPPSRAEILSLVGLSLPRMIANLTRDLGDDVSNDILAYYKVGFVDAVARQGEAPLYDGVEDGLKRLQQNGITLGIATGKSQRGLDRLIGALRWGSLFSTLQCADHHPSKPHPSMVRRALLETATEPDRAVVVGDTSFDLEMARNGEVRSLGVSWGYHPTEVLLEAGAETVADDFATIVDLILEMAE